VINQELVEIMMKKDAGGYDGLPYGSKYPGELLFVARKLQA
jgi:hypothetical protein